MTFERSKSGQENRAAFLGVDLVCYVEGGGGNSDFSDDVLFWKSVFDGYRPDLKIHFLARGGKPELEARARDILAKGIEHSLVAMDADYDELTGDKIHDSRILYTYGYSWENDVLSKKSLDSVLAHSMGAATPPDEQSKFLHSKFDELAKKLVWPVRADYYALASKSSILPRSSPGRVIENDPATGFPTIRRNEVLKLCAANKTKPRELPNLPSLVDSMRYCVGKVFSHLVRMLLCSVHKHFSRAVNFSKEHLHGIALLLFPKVVRALPNSEINKHYQTITAAI